MKPGKHGIPKHLQNLHKLCSNHRFIVEPAAKVGCFFCGDTFPPSEIVEWTDTGTTAICPRCSVDAIVPTADKNTLTQMSLAYFFPFIHQVRTCIDNTGYPASLTVGNTYQTCPSEHNMVRVLDDTGEQYLYDPARFTSAEAARQAPEVSTPGADADGSTDDP